MSKVYVVTKGSYSDYRIVSVFSSQELADLFMQTYPPNSSSYDNYNDVEEYELDVFEEQIRAGTKSWFVRMYQDGTVDHVQEESPPENPGSVVWNSPRGLFINVTTWADDGQHAIKIANEHRSALIAANRFTHGFKSDFVAPVSGNEPMLGGGNGAQSDTQ